MIDYAMGSIDADQRSWWLNLCRLKSPVLLPFLEDFLPVSLTVEVAEAM